MYLSPRAMAASFTSYNTVGYPACILHKAMPEPITPEPTTATFIMIQRYIKVSGLRLSIAKPTLGILFFLAFPNLKL